MTGLISPTRLDLNDRFSVAGFTIQTDPAHPWFEVALATDPAYFKFENRGKRTPATFFSTRAIGALPTDRGEAVFLAPPEALGRFIGQSKLYYALATFGTPAR